MFVEHGFDEVKVLDLAAAVGMAPSTLYRYFPTKEALVLWDEHEHEYGPGLEQQLLALPPFSALREAFVTGVADHYDTDAEFHLERIALIYRTPTIWAAAAELDRRDRQDLAELLEHHLSSEGRGAAQLLAGAALMAADWAFERWQATAGRDPAGRSHERGLRPARPPRSPDLSVRAGHRRRRPSRVRRQLGARAPGGSSAVRTGGWRVGSTTPAAVRTRARR